MSCCLALARESSIFLGFLGERYGWVPPPQEGGRDGASITQLEMEEGALEKGEGARGSAQTPLPGCYGTSKSPGLIWLNSL